MISRIPNPQSPTPVAQRHGISIIEVLVSMFILSVGLMGIASLLPIGQRQALLADQQDRLSSLGQNAVRSFRTRGLSNFQWWCTASGASVTQSSGAPNAVFQNGPIFIDPLLTAAKGNAVSQVPHTGTSRFLRFGIKTNPNSSANLTNYGVVGSGDAYRAQAEAIFMSRDDAAITPGTTPESASTAKFYKGGGSTDLRRDFDGEYSWAAMLTPTYVNNYPIGTAKGTPYAEQSCQLHIVVFYRRPLSSLVDENKFYGRSIPREREVSAAITGGGIGGGEVTISTTASGYDLLVTPGEYVLLFQPGSNYFAQWYRVLGAQTFDPSSETSRQLTLTGPDWPAGMNNPRMIIFDGAVGVYTKSIRLEGPSMWNN